MKRIGVGQERDVGRRESADKTSLGLHVALGERFARAYPTHQAFQLRDRVARGALKIAHHNPLLDPRQVPIAKTPDHCANKRIALGILADGIKLHLPCAV